MKFIKFFSTAKDIGEEYGLPKDAPRLLSNFASTPVTWRGYHYPTAEHAFQAAKYVMATDLPNTEVRFRIGGDVVSATHAKYLGGKKGMAENGTYLKIDVWEQTSVSIMREILASKINENAKVAEILRICRAKDLKLLHHSRGDMKWGCHSDGSGKIKKGENMLGVILGEFEV